MIFGASPLPSGEIVFSRRAIMGLEVLQPETSEVKVLNEPNPAEREKGHRLSDVLPGGKADLFTSSTIDITSFDDAKIRVLDLETGRIETLIDGGTCARYGASGHIVYYRSGTLFAVPFDAAALRLTGPAVSIQTGVTANQYSAAEFAIADNGTLVFAPGDPASQDHRIVRIDRQGRKEPLHFNAPASGELSTVRLSPNEDFLAVQTGGTTDQVWIYDIVRGTPTRLTFEWDNLNVAWAPDSARVAFRSSRDRGSSLCAMSIGESGNAERLMSSAHVVVPHDWFPDGKTLVYEVTVPETGNDLWLSPLDGNRDPGPFVRTKFDERNADVSPDGRFVAYQSNESGRWEIYIRAVADLQSKTQVSTARGTSATVASRRHGDFLLGAAHAHGRRCVGARRSAHAGKASRAVRR